MVKYNDFYEEEEELEVAEESQLEEREYERELSRKRREGLLKEKEKRERKLTGAAKPKGKKPQGKPSKTPKKFKHYDEDDYDY